jgi:EAL domain-containing protein (putative c-di-GMP-specific phosphodiesterase class I)
MSLVRGIDRDDVRGQLVRGAVSCAEHVGARLVAGGIETVGELDALRGLGVGYGQGYLFTRPVEPFPADKDVTPVFTD